MTTSTPALRLTDGSGVLARHGALVLLCSTDGASADAVDQLLEVHAEVAAKGGDATVLADRLAEALSAADETSLVAFGPAGSALLVVVYGYAWITVTTEDGEQSIAKSRPRDGVRHVLPGRLVGVRAGLGGVDPGARPQRWVSLGEGVARAGGLIYVAADGAPQGRPSGTEPAHADTAELPVTPTPGGDRVEAPPERAVDRSQEFSSVVLIQGAGPAGPPVPRREPLPVVTAAPPPVAPDVAPAAHPVDESRAQVLGVYCKNGHFDDPTARYCAICGISMAQLTLVPRLGPRPPLGVLVLDDGSIFSIDTDYVIGRDPARDPDVIAGSARPLRFDDTEGVLSRQHARIVLDGWQVNIVDLGSANGTGVLPPGDTQWQQIPARTVVPIRPGTQVGFGRRNLRYESHRNT